MALSVLQLLFIGVMIGFFIGRILAKIEIAGLSKFSLRERRKLKNILLREFKKKPLKLKYEVSSSYLTSSA